MSLPIVPAYLRVGAPFGDSAADPDREPDLLWADSGSVALVPVVGNLTAPDADGRDALLAMVTFVGTIKAGGRIAWEHETADPDNNVLVVDLTDESLPTRVDNPDGSTHRLEFRSVAIGATSVFPLATFDVRIAADMLDANGVVNLAHQIQASADVPVVVDRAVTDAAVASTISQPSTSAEIAQLISGSPAVTDRVPSTRKVNGKALAADVTLSAADVSAATADQGAKADSARQPGSLTTTAPAVDAKLTGVRALLANRRNARVNVACIGDSYVEGYGLTAWRHTLPAQLAAELRARYPVAGVAGGPGYVGVVAPTATLPFWPVTITGGTVNSDGYGPNFRRWVATAAGQKVVFDLAALGGAVTSFDILHVKSSSGTAAGGYYKIDGGAAVNFATNNTSFISALTAVAAAATSTIEIGWAAGSFSLFGLRLYRGDEAAGLVVDNFGASGTTAKTWNDYSPLTLMNAIALTNPHLVLVSLGGNDANTTAGNRTAAQYKADLTTFIANLRAKGVTAPIVLTEGSYSDTSLREPWANYVAAAAEVASADATVVMVDHRAYMTANLAADPLGLYSTSYPGHGTAKGYAVMVESLAGLIARA